MLFCRGGAWFKTSRQRTEPGLVLLTCVLLCSVAVPPVWGTSENGTAPRTWKTVDTLSPEELALVDLHMADGGGVAWGERRAAHRGDVGGGGGGVGAWQSGGSGWRRDRGGG